jgi:hypothetical protein
LQGGHKAYRTLKREYDRKEHVNGRLNDDREMLKWAKSLVGWDGSWKSKKIIHVVF